MERWLFGLRLDGISIFSLNMVAWWQHTTQRPSQKICMGLLVVAKALQIVREPGRVHPGGCEVLLRVVTQTLAEEGDLEVFKEKGVVQDIR